MRCYPNLDPRPNPHLRCLYRFVRDLLITMADLQKPVITLIRLRLNPVIQDFDLISECQILGCKVKMGGKAKSGR